jgi:hypothetical protein
MMGPRQEVATSSSESNLTDIGYPAVKGARSGAKPRIAICVRDLAGGTGTRYSVTVNPVVLAGAPGCR